MFKRLLMIAALIAVFAIPSYAGELTAANDNVGDIEEVLKRLKGNPGLYGASGQEMSQFIDMIDSAELASLVASLSAELQAQGDVENLDMEKVSAFVAQRLTKGDAERLLGQSVSEDQFQRAVGMGRQSENIDQLVEMLRTK